VGPADVAASNGVIQVIDHVLIPSNIALPSKDIVQTAQATPPLSTLVKAVVAASLAAALSQPNGPFTVFAPLDTAFAAVPSQVLSCLLSNPDALRVLLLSHVVSGLVYSSDIPTFTTVTTLSGKQLSLSVRGTVVSIVYSTLLFPSNVVIPNVDTSNGVVHVIDRVLFDNSGPCGH
jgi:transforming growth factor-beta-induced protein